MLCVLFYRSELKWHAPEELSMPLVRFMRPYDSQCIRFGELIWATLSVQGVKPADE
jgi:hypothetical protein